MIRSRRTARSSDGTPTRTCTMCWRIFRRCGELTAASALALIGLGAGQGVDPAALQKAAVDSWPTYHGDYSGRRHSPLISITPANVSQLALAWAFQTGQSASIKATPIVVNGMMFVSAPDQVWAIDARTGRQVWQYRY